MINIVSKHLNKVSIKDKLLLDNIYLVEKMRYHKDNFNKGLINSISLPLGFESGLENVNKEEELHLYKFMCIWFELEGFIVTGRTFLDQFWKTIRKKDKKIQKIKDIRNQKYVINAMKELNNKKFNFTQSVTLNNFKQLYDDWGQYLIRFRNHIVYEQHFGGFVQWDIIGKIIQQGEKIDLILPDEFPESDPKKAGGKNKNFTFSKNISALFFMNDIIIKIDKIFDLIFKDIKK